MTSRPAPLPRPLAMLGALLLLASGSGCRGSFGSSAEARAPMTHRSADEILRTARLPPETGAPTSFEVHRLDAFAACSSARGRLRAEASGSGTATTVGLVAAVGLGVVGGLVTAGLAASLDPPPVPSTPQPPDAEPPDIEGKTGVVAAGVLTGVAVLGVGAGVLLFGGKGDDEGKGKLGRLDAEIQAFEAECRADPPPDRLELCTQRARALAQTCRGQGG